ncbi:N-acetyltransferase [Clostridium zeae]|uniref:N-acetyltransferase n=1 Tax=Clostridium zeae TaxID=2759022 RepID=A0ABQ1EA95_9CLOT|nr:GNAT family N-acetyltransferase [Clostridium zeae]GFZ31707.1 N-acetyltransferase [Clostridium zeae]
MKSFDMEKMNEFRFITGGIELLDLVRPLWQMLNELHKEKSKDFQNQYISFTFEERKKKLMVSKHMHIDIIADSSNKYIAYCISTIDSELVGEVDSLFIKEDARKLGLGDELLKRSLSWMENNNVRKKIITVAAGNEDVINFYNKYGFKKRRIILEYVEE